MSNFQLQDPACQFIKKQQTNGHVIVAVQPQASLDGICGGQSGTRPGFSLSITVLPGHHST